MENEMKICRSCKWCRVLIGGDYGEIREHMCSNNSSVDPVTGSSIYQPCKSERTLLGKCGPGGLLWEEIPPKPKSFWKKFWDGDYA